MRMAKFSDQIRKCVATSMDKNKLTQTALAECTEVDQGAISRFLSSQSGLSLDALDRICDVLNIRAVNRRTSETK
jgi:transcriptional regulator with XRE-family HTH domain